MMPPFYPRRKRADICDGADPRIMCSLRRAEVMAGAFGWDERRQGYYHTELIGPWGIPVLLDACPMCYELLPGYYARKRFEVMLEAEEAEKRASAPKLLPPPPDNGPTDQISGKDSICYLDDGEGEE